MAAAGNGDVALCRQPLFLVNVGLLQDVCKQWSTDVGHMRIRDSLLMFAFHHELVVAALAWTVPAECMKLPDHDAPLGLRRKHHSTLLDDVEVDVTHRRQVSIRILDFKDRPFESDLLKDGQRLNGTLLACPDPREVANRS